MMDWSDSSRIDRFAFEMVDPNDLDSSRGWLEGVVRDGSSLTFAYYADTRASGKLRVADCNYIEDSLIRVHHYVDAEGYHAELGTFFVNDADLSFEHGAWGGSMELASRLAALSDDHWVRHYSIAAGKTTQEVLSAIFSELGVTYRILPGCRNTQYGSAVVYEFGESVMTTAFEVSDKMSARLDVDGHGVVEVCPYVIPSSRTPVFEYGADMVTSAIKKTTNIYDMPGRVGVIHTMSDDREIASYADAAASSPAARSRRGRRITEIVSLPDMSPETSQKAGEEARRLVDNATDLSVEYDFDALYMPIPMGSVGWLDCDGARVKCMAKTFDVSLSPGLSTHVTLKEVG